MKKCVTKIANVLPDVVIPLLKWYRKNARVLPWRDAPTPYRVWVSEIMLQQTRVEAVKGCFERFMQMLPDIDSLARVPDDELMKLWEGLGYYNRARNMKRAAETVVEKYDGVLPTTYEELRDLPGIGDYTAGAIASIAYGLPHPAVDGNVLRVLARLRANRKDVTQPKVKKEAEALLWEIMPTDAAGDFTQAMMELGATVCLPNGAPLCGQCPLSNLCKGYAAGIQEELPIKKEKPKRRAENRTVLVVTNGGRMALQKRGEKGLLAGMWELPSLDGFCEEKQLRVWAEERGLGAVLVKRLPDAKHIFTHVEWKMHGYHIEVSEESAGFCWVHKDELERHYAIPSAFRAFLSHFCNKFGN